MLHWQLTISNLERSRSFRKIFALNHPQPTVVIGVVHDGGFPSRRAQGSPPLHLPVKASLSSMPKAEPPSSDDSKRRGKPRGTIMPTNPSTMSKMVGLKRGISMDEEHARADSFDEGTNIETALENNGERSDPSSLPKF